VRPRRDQAVPPLWSDVFTRLQICCPDLLALGGAKRGLGAEAPCWPDRAFAVNCQLEAAAPRPRFPASRLRVNPSVGGTTSQREAHAILPPAIFESECPRRDTHCHLPHAFMTGRAFPPSISPMLPHLLLSISLSGAQLIAITGILGGVSLTAVIIIFGLKSSLRRQELWHETARVAPGKRTTPAAGSRAARCRSVTAHSGQRRSHGPDPHRVRRGYLPFSRQHHQPLFRFRRSHSRPHGGGPAAPRAAIAEIAGWWRLTGRSLLT
jgi:hypothetical protein